MNMKQNFIIIIFLAIGVAFNSCKQSTSVITSGEILGAVQLFDTTNNSIANAEGVKVSVEGGSQFTLTNSAGNFSLSGLPDGEIILIFSKSGFAEVRNTVQINSAGYSVNYGTQHLYTISHLSPDIVLRPFEPCFIKYNFRDTQIFSNEAGGHFLHVWVYDSLYEDFGISQFSSRILDAPNNAGSYGASIKIYFGAQDSITPTDPGTFAFSSEILTVDNSDGLATMNIYRDSLLHHGFQSNSKIYCAAFAAGLLTQNQFYTDKTTGQNIYTGFSPIHSEIRNFILP
jgi:hypothetical protein